MARLGIALSDFSKYVYEQRQQFYLSLFVQLRVCSVFFFISFIIENPVLNANSTGPDHVLYCLPMSLLWDVSQNYVQEIECI